MSEEENLKEGAPCKCGHPAYAGHAPSCEFKTQSSESISLEAIARFKDQVAKLSPEAIAKITGLGFDIENDPEGIARLINGKIDSAVKAAETAGYDLKNCPEPMHGQSKVVYVLPDGKVLKLLAVSDYLNEVVQGEDELTFCQTVEREVGPEAHKLVALVESAGKGIPGTTQEFAFKTSEIIKIARKHGDHATADLIQAAHLANPLVKNAVFEQKTRNTGLVLREDGKVYVVATDISGGVDLDDTPGGWDKIRDDMKDIVGIEPAQLAHVPEIKKWLES